MHEFSYVAYTLHDRAGTLASLLYKAEKPSVRPSVCIFCHEVILAVSAWIDIKFGLCTAVVSVT